MGFLAGFIAWFSPWLWGVFLELLEGSCLSSGRAGRGCGAPPALEPSKKPAWKLQTVPSGCWWSFAHWGLPTTHGGDLLIAALMSLPPWALVWPRCRDCRSVRT